MSFSNKLIEIGLLYKKTFFVIKTKVVGETKRVTWIAESKEKSN